MKLENLQANIGVVISMLISVNARKKLLNSLLYFLVEKVSTAGGGDGQREIKKKLQKLCFVFFCFIQIVCLGKIKHQPKALTHVSTQCITFIFSSSNCRKIFFLFVFFRSLNGQSSSFNQNERRRKIL